MLFLSAQPPENFFNWSHISSNTLGRTAHYLFQATDLFEEIRTWYVFP